MKFSFRALGFSISIVGFACAAAVAEVRMPAVFSDGMVLQRDMPVPVWGTASPGEKITVTLGKSKTETTAGTNGQWKVALRRLKAGGPYTLTAAGASNAVTATNVLVGEVWLASGQSNMEFGLGGATNAPTEIAAAQFPEIRQFSARQHVAIDGPTNNLEGAWTVCSAQTAARFSAVAYFFARDLHQKLKTPVGIVSVPWSGMNIQPFMIRDVVQVAPQCAFVREYWREYETNYPALKAAFDKAMERWAQDAEKAKTDGKPEPKKPQPPVEPARKPMDYGRVYDGMVGPLVPYAIRGAIWYQGESNGGEGDRYRKLFPEMIREWRQAWGEGDFPFLFVQLANFMDRKTDPNAISAWAELREAQSMTLLAAPRTAMAVAIDIGEARDIHPRNKQDVGRRLALGARVIAYGERRLEYSGPVYESMAIEGNAVRLKFAHAGGGLAAGLAAKGDKLTGFAVAGEDRKWAWADAKIDGRTVVVSSPEVAKPVAVRYAWGDNPDCNLLNREGLPASPFRTDDWPRPEPAAAKK